MAVGGFNAVQRRWIVFEPTSVSVAMHRDVTVDVVAEGMRLDAGIAVMFPPLSRTRSHQLIARGVVRIDGSIETRPSVRLKAGQRVEVNVPDSVRESLSAEHIALDVIYEDTSIAVINKPAGMVVHPSVGHESGTVANAALHRFGVLPSAGGTRRSGIVHRLDRDTSGVMVLARTEEALADLLRQFASRTVKKEYLTLARGSLPDTGTIDQPIGRDPRDRQRMTIIPGGRRSVSRFERLCQYHRAALLRVHLDTGRTHQIRIHLSAIGHPVFGDTVYGGAQDRTQRPGSTSALGRQFLHASHLAITLPGTSRRLVCAAALPADLRSVLAAVGDDNPTMWAPTTSFRWRVEPASDD